MPEFAKPIGGMMAADTRKFYIRIESKDGVLVRHAISTALDSFQSQGDLNLDEASEKKADPESEGSPFQAVFDEFVGSIESYMSFMPLTLHIVPELARAIAETQIAKFARSRGRKLEESSSDAIEIWELDNALLSEAWTRHERINAAGEGVRLLPQTLIVGLISTYDAFLANLLRATFAVHPEIVLTSDKQITFKDLLTFENIEAAREELIDREIESVLRKSHVEQFDWMQNTLKVKLRDRLSVWPQFVELCERRNLFTHTGGRVSAQYIKVCSAHKCAKTSKSVGERISVDGDYYQQSVEVVYEIGLKLCYVFWRKFSEHTAREADSDFNAKCMQLINSRAYELAESLLRFSITVPRLQDDVRKMMRINLANSLRLQERQDEARKVLDDEDWSAINEEFKICLHAVRGEADQVIEMMRDMGTRMSAGKYRTWPIFRGMRATSAFQDAFEAIYGQPMIAISGDKKPELPVPTDKTVH